MENGSEPNRIHNDRTLTKNNMGQAPKFGHSLVLLFIVKYFRKYCSMQYYKEANETANQNR